MKKIVFCFLGLVLMMGCQSLSSKHFVPRDSEYVGQTREDLVRDFGQPDMIYREYLCDDDCLNVYLIYNTVSMNRRCSWCPNYECRTIFLMQGEQVVGSFYDASTCIVP